jgi:hypothetical protein
MNLVTSIPQKPLSDWVESFFSLASANRWRQTQLNVLRSVGQRVWPWVEVTIQFRGPPVGGE